MRILLVSAFDICGGAEKMAWYLHQAYRAQGHESWLAVGRKLSDDPYTFPLPYERYPASWQKRWKKLGDWCFAWAGKIKGAGRLTNFWYNLADPQRIGRDNFQYPATWHLSELLPLPPDIIHCFNLHAERGYFDLRALPALSKRVPVIMTLNDAWLLTGHCAHPFDCMRWKIGCGACPNLTTYPAICRDATAFNWRKKQRIYRRSQLFAGVPSRWLIGLVGQSMLASELCECRLIHCAIDTSVFHPGDQQAAREQLHLPRNARLLLFTANGIRNNPFKDYRTMQTAVARVAERVTVPLYFIAIGEDAPSERIGAAEIHFVPYQKDPQVIARYCQAADIYLHAAKGEVWGIVITEAMACGTPVVATTVGGIPEQIEHGVTGFLTPPGDAEAMSHAIQQLLEDPLLQQEMGKRAADSARHYSVERLTTAYLEWYQDVLHVRRRTTICDVRR